MDWTKIIGIIIGFIGSLASSGPWGLAAMGLGGAGLLGAIYFLIKKNNSRVDKGDFERAGEVSGKEAMDLRNQAEANRDWLEKETKEFKEGASGGEDKK